MTERKMTAAQAAKEAGIPDATFYAIMQRGTCNGTTLGKLARFVGVKAYEMVDV